MPWLLCRAPLLFSPAIATVSPSKHCNRGSVIGGIGNSFNIYINKASISLLLGIISGDCIFLLSLGVGFPSEKITAGNFQCVRLE